MLRAYQLIFIHHFSNSFSNVGLLQSKPSFLLQHARQPLTDQTLEILARIRAQTDKEDAATYLNNDDQRTQHQEYSGIQYAEPAVVHQRKYKNPEVIEYLKRDIFIDPNNLSPKHRNLPDFSNFNIEKRVFSDTEWKGRPALKLYPLTEDGICQLGKAVFEELTTGISRSSIAAIMLLAYQLSAPGMGRTEHVFPITSDLIFITPQDEDYPNLSGVKMSAIGIAGSITESNDTVENAKAYAFLSASMLRMFTRSAKDYSLAWADINKGFRTFYSRNCPLSGFRPDLEVLKTIHSQFSMDPLLKSTLFRILYHANDCTFYESLKKFLFDTHLSHTGLHALPITVKLSMALNCSSGMILSFLDGGEFDRQLDALSTLLLYMISTDENKKRGMWRYGRLFDQNFMSSLHTKTCPKLVYILASALKAAERPVENAGILNIYHLQNLRDMDKKRCQFDIVKKRR